MEDDNQGGTNQDTKSFRDVITQQMQGGSIEQ